MGRLIDTDDIMKEMGTFQQLNLKKERQVNGNGKHSRTASEHSRLSHVQYVVQSEPRKNSGSVLTAEES